ncbi:reverse transcriptase domain, reverse transcriptase zinc-binding domain protein, partial [Tanacetum coccineum]
MGVLPQLREDGLLENKPLAILERKLGKVNNKPVMFMLIQWNNKPVEEATWEIYGDLITRFPGQYTLEVVPYPDTTPNWVVSTGAFIERTSDPGYQKKTIHQLLFTAVTIHRILFIKGYCSSGKKTILRVTGHGIRRQLAPTTLGETFSIARIMEARFETIAGKKLNIEEKMDIVLSWLSEEAPPVIKGSLDANEDIGVVEVSRAIDDVFDIGESNVESMEVRSEFSEFLENKESVKEVVVGGGEVCGVGEDELNRVISALKDGGGEFDGHLDEINLNLSEELTDNGVSPIPTSLVAHESPQVRQLWERIGIGDAQGLMENERNHKFVQPNVWGWMPDSQSAYSSYHLEG